MVKCDREAEAKVSATIFVSGKVQGVYFRKFTLENAQYLGLKGFVRNLPDGRVMAVAEGSRADIMTFIDFLHIGPERSRVDSVDVEWTEHPEGHSGFKIRR